jgi:predicted transcriptional regulator
MYRAAGLTYPAIARKLGITERAVGRILTDAGLTTSQGDLFR